MKFLAIFFTMNDSENINMIKYLCALVVSIFFLHTDVIASPDFSADEGSGSQKVKYCAGTDCKPLTAGQSSSGLKKCTNDKNCYYETCEGMSCEKKALQSPSYSPPPGIVRCEDSGSCSDSKCSGVSCTPEAGTGLTFCGSSQTSCLVNCNSSDPDNQGHYGPSACGICSTGGCNGIDEGGECELDDGGEGECKASAEACDENSNCGGKCKCSPKDEEAELL